MSAAPTRGDMDVAHEPVIRDVESMENWNDQPAAAINPPTMRNAEAESEPPPPANRVPTERESTKPLQ